MQKKIDAVNDLPDDRYWSGNAQISKVTGNVTSEEDGLPVVGASVLVKGTTVGTVPTLMVILR